MDLLPTAGVHVAPQAAGASGNGSCNQWSSVLAYFGETLGASTITKESVNIDCTDVSTYCTNNKMSSFRPEQKAFTPVRKAQPYQNLLLT